MKFALLPLLLAPVFLPVPTGAGNAGSYIEMVEVQRIEIIRLKSALALANRDLAMRSDCGESHDAKAKRMGGSVASPGKWVGQR